MRIAAFLSLYTLAVATLAEAATHPGPVIHDGVLRRNPDPGASDWIEIYNPHGAPLDLTSMRLHAEGQTLYVFAGVLKPFGECGVDPETDDLGCDRYEPCAAIL